MRMHARTYSSGVSSLGAEPSAGVTVCWGLTLASYHSKVVRRCVLPDARRPVPPAPWPMSPGVLDGAAPDAGMLERPLPPADGPQQPPSARAARAATARPAMKNA